MADPTRVIPATMMSTHAIKTELRRRLTEVAPEKKWHNRSTIIEMSEFAVRNLDPSSRDPRVLRTIELGRVMYDNERSSK